MIKAVKGWSGYFISDKGNVISRHGPKPIVLKTRIATKRGGYVLVDLRSGPVLKKTFRLHRLVTQAFITNPENKKEVNHKNGIKTDNRLENLEWSTRTENTKHAVENGLVPKGDRHYNSKLTLDQVTAIRILGRSKNYTHEKISSWLPVNRRHVTSIINGNRR